MRGFWPIFPYKPGHTFLFFYLINKIDRAPAMHFKKHAHKKKISVVFASYSSLLMLFNCYVHEHICDLKFLIMYIKISPKRIFYLQPKLGKQYISCLICCMVFFLLSDYDGSSFVQFP